MQGRDPLNAYEPAWVFYDGGCGLCHAAVRFCLAHDADGTRFRFAPIDGAAWRARFPAGPAPQGTFVFDEGVADPLERSTAALAVLRRIGGAWGLLGRLGRILPRFVRDALYDLVAGVRRRLFRAPASACPTPRADLRTRFDLTP